MESSLSWMRDIIVGVWLLLLLVPVALVLWFVGIYNGLVRLRNQMREAWSGIDVQLKRRYDLIPNLVETVKGYASHERELLERVTQARAQAQAVQGVAEKGVAEANLTNAIRGLFAVVENYPELKANQGFLELQGSLQQIEDDLQMARRYYNGTVRELNTAVESFPSNIVAGIGHFQQAEFFEVESAAEREAPKVAF